MTNPQKAMLYSPPLIVVIGSLAWWGIEVLLNRAMGVKPQGFISVPKVRRLQAASKKF